MNAPGTAELIMTMAVAGQPLVILLIIISMFYRKLSQIASAVERLVETQTEAALNSPLRNKE